MSKYDRDRRDVHVVKRLGDEIGYGHLMALAHELWARHLEEKGLPREGAYCVVGYSMIKDEYQADALTDPIYKVIVDRALTEPNSSEKPNNCETCRFELYWPEICEGCCEWNSHYEPNDEPYEFGGTITLTENSSKELLKWLKEQDEVFINDVLDGRYGFTLTSADGRSVELVPKTEQTEREG